MKYNIYQEPKTGLNKLDSLFYTLVLVVVVV